MLKTASQSFLHMSAIGGLALAALVVRKGRGEKYTDSDFEMQKETPRATASPVCRGCLSCDRNRCHFAFRKFPHCFLAK